MRAVHNDKLSFLVAPDLDGCFLAILQNFFRQESNLFRFDFTAALYRNVKFGTATYDPTKTYTSADVLPANAIGGPEYWILNYNPRVYRDGYILNFDPLVTVDGSIPPP